MKIWLSLATFACCVTQNAFANTIQPPLCSTYAGMSVEQREQLMSSQPSTLNKMVLEYYCQWDNYSKVYDDVMKWFGTTTNGCVAFMGTALRHVGVALPTARSNDPISTVTHNFSYYLEKRLNWTRLSSMDDLRPGDLIFTMDDPDWPGYPDHVFLFLNWANADQKLVWSVDNQAHTHIRDLTNPKSRYTPFQYALRAPQ